MKLTKICHYCKNQFTARTTVTKYCSDYCSKRGYKARKRAEKIGEAIEETTKQIEQPITDIQAREFLSINNVCILFDISRSTVWRLMKSGRIEVANIGKRRFVKRSSLDKLFHYSQNDESQKISAEIDLNNCWNLSQIQHLFKISEKALYHLILKHNIRKVSNGRFVYVEKQEIIDVLEDSENWKSI